MRIKRSSILAHFQVNSNIAICKICNTSLKGNRTNNLKTHLVRIHKIQFAELDKKTIAAKTFKVQLKKECDTTFQAWGFSHGVKKEPIKTKRPSICISADADLSDFGDISTSLSTVELPSTSVTTPYEKEPMRLRLHTPTSVQMPLEKLQTNSGILNQPTSIEENEYDCFGKSIGCQLKRLPESVAQQSMASIQTYLVKQRLKVIKSSIANEHGSDDPINL